MQRLCKKQMYLEKVIFFAILYENEGANSALSSARIASTILASWWYFASPLSMGSSGAGGLRSSSGLMGCWATEDMWLGDPWPPGAEASMSFEQHNHICYWHGTPFLHNWCGASLGAQNSNHQDCWRGLLSQHNEGENGFSRYWNVHGYLHQWRHLY